MVHASIHGGDIKWRMKRNKLLKTAPKNDRNILFNIRIYIFLNMLLIDRVITHGRRDWYTGRINGN